MTGNEFIAYMTSSPAHAAAFMSGFKRVAPMSKFPSPSSVEDRAYLDVRSTSEGIPTPSEAAILDDVLLARAFLVGASLGQAMLGPPGRQDIEILHRALLVSDVGSECVYHLFRDEAGATFVGTHLKGAKCDYCVNGAENHLGDPYASAIRWDASRSFTYAAT